MDQFPDAPLSKHTQHSRRRLSGACEGSDGSRGGQQGVMDERGELGPGSLHLVGRWRAGEEPRPAHKACLVRDKRRAPGGPYGTIFTIRASLFSLGLWAGACQESSVLAGLEVVLGSGDECVCVCGGWRGGVSLTGWARGFRSSLTSCLTTSVCFMLSGTDFKLLLKDALLQLGPIIIIGWLFVVVTMKGTNWQINFKHNKYGNEPWISIFFFQSD